MNQDASMREKLKFIMLLAKALHHYGASADRIEKALFLVSEKLNVEANFFSLPTGIFANFNLPGEDEYTSMVRMDPGTINLEKLYLADRTVDFVLDEKVTISEGCRILTDIFTKKPLYGDLAVNISLFFLAFGIAIFLKGNLYDAICSGIFGLFCGFFTSSVKVESVDTITDALLAFGVSFAAFGCEQMGLHVTPSIIILASLIYFLPGLSLTMSIHEISSQNLTSGTARLTGALIILLKISFGSFMGAEVAKGVFPATFSIPEPPMGSIWQWPAIVLVALSFVVIFQARIKDAFWIVMAGLISFSVSSFLGAKFGAVAGAVGCGVMLGAGSNLFARVLKRPAMIVLMPAITLLVPGSIGYKGLNFLFTQNAVDGINTLFHTITIGVGLVAGAYFGNILIKPKRTL